MNAESTTPTRYEITSTQFFTTAGIWGVCMFLAGPFVSGAGYAWLLSELAERYSFQQNLPLPILFMAMGGLATTGGLALMLVGRSHKMVAFPIAENSIGARQLWS